LNAKDAGLSLVPTAVGSSDLRLVRIPFASPDPWVALEAIAAQTNLPHLQNQGSSVDELYLAEQAALASQRVVPLFHLPVFYAAGPSLRDWTVRTEGSLDLDAAWLGAEK
jgi:MarR-like DNA-binding transcriptional regulator SgrR of sgrS sRNA